MPDIKLNTRTNDHIVLIIEIITFYLIDNKVLLNKHNTVLNEQQIREIVFGIKPGTYSNFKNGNTSLQKIINRYKEKTYSFETNIKSIGMFDTIKVNYLKEQKQNFNFQEPETNKIEEAQTPTRYLLEIVKFVLIKYQLDLEFDQTIIKKINTFHDLNSLLYYLFTNAVNKVGNRKFIKINLKDLEYALRKDFKKWQFNQNIDDITFQISEYYLTVKLDYFFSNPNQKYVFYVHIYNGNNLDGDIKYVLENYQKSNKKKIQMICILNPYHNWIKKEKFIDKEIYIVSIKKHDIYKQFNQNDNKISNELENIFLVNSVSKEVIRKIDNNCSLILKKYLVENNNSFSRELIDNFEYKLLAKTSNLGNCKSVLLYGEYSCSYISKLKEHFTEITVFSNSYTYVNAMICDEKMRNVSFVCFYLGIADSIIAPLKKEFDLIIIGGGQGSFFSKLKKYMTYFNYMLKDKGQILFSVYNEAFNLDGILKQTLVNNFQLIYSPIQKKVFYSMENTNKYMYINCICYDSHNLINKMNNYFIVDYCYTFPMLSLLNFETEGMTKVLKEEIDQTFSLLCPHNKTNYNGYFLYSLLRKEEIKFEFFKQDLNKKIFKILEHEPIFNKTVWKNKLLDILDKEKIYLFLKVIILKNTKLDKYAIVLTLYEKHLPTVENQDYVIRLDTETFRLLNIREINAIGIEIENISPFQLKEMTFNSDYYYDQILDVHNKKSRNKDKNLQPIIVVGNGNCKESCQMNLNAFIKTIKSLGFKSKII